MVASCLRGTLFSVVYTPSPTMYHEVWEGPPHLLPVVRVAVVVVVVVVVVVPSPLPLPCLPAHNQPYTRHAVTFCAWLAAHPFHLNANVLLTNQCIDEPTSTPWICKLAALQSLSFSLFGGRQRVDGGALPVNGRPPTPSMVDGPHQ